MHCSRRYCLLIKPYLAKLQMKQAGRNERWSHAQHRQEEQKDTQSNSSPKTWQRDITPGKHPKQLLCLVNSYQREYCTRSTWGESFCWSYSCCSILLLLQLQVLLFTRSKDFPDRKRDGRKQSFKDFKEAIKYFFFFFNGNIIWHTLLFQAEYF